MYLVECYSERIDKYNEKYYQKSFHKWETKEKAIDFIKYCKLACNHTKYTLYSLIEESLDDVDS
jgi:hypothetical protein